MIDQLKSIYNNYFLLVTICLFVVIYYIMNQKNISEGTYNTNQLIKPVLLTVVITLILYLFYGCDDKTYSMHKTYKIINKSNAPKLNDNIFMPQHEAIKMGLNI